MSGGKEITLFDLSQLHAEHHVWLIERVGKEEGESVSLTDSSERPCMSVFARSE